MQGEHTMKLTTLNMGWDKRLEINKTGVIFINTYHPTLTLPQCLIYFHFRVRAYLTKAFHTSQ